MGKTLVLIAVLLVAVGCGDGEPSGATTDLPRPDGDWQLVDGVVTSPEFPITMSITGTEVSGRAACNSYFGTVMVNTAAIEFGEMGSTAMACEPAAMAAESAFLTALAAAEAFEYRNDRLVLTGPSDDLVFAPVAPVPTAALLDTTWVLETLIEGEAATSANGEPASLALAADGTLTASTGCRTLTGRWLESGGVIIVPELAAEGECPDALWKQDSLVVTVVGDEFRAEVDGDVLTLTSMGGDGLVYRAVR
ncbi:MAG: META domain-containing protein [Acidimicrobiia bacterium]|nr:META domain-containing protein [Acidimicrobiia bacterium]